MPWGSDGLFAIIIASGALALFVLAFVVPRLGRFGEGWVHYGPWLIAIGVWLTLWELDDGEIWLAAEAVLLAAERPSQRLRHRGVATF